MITTRAETILAEQAGDVRSLEESLANPDATLRALAIGSLGRLKQITLAHIEAGLGDNDRNVRVRAIEVAIAHHDIDLTPLLDDQDDLVVETAAWALGERESAEDRVITALCRVGADHDVSICREAAIAALGAIGSEAGLATILGGLEDRAPVRRRAVLALAPFAGPLVDAALERATTDRDRQVRQAAEDLL